MGQFLYGNYGYNTFPSTYAYGGIHHLGKREAEADPALVYSSGYHYPTVYSGIHNGKRSADAEPKADAALIYSGLHYPSTYGYGLHNYGKREAEAEPWRSYYGGYSGYGRGYGYSGYG